MTHKTFAQLDRRNLFFLICKNNQEFQEELILHRFPLLHNNVIVTVV